MMHPPHLLKSIRIYDTGPYLLGIGSMPKFAVSHTTSSSCLCAHIVLVCAAPALALAASLATECFKEQVCLKLETVDTLSFLSAVLTCITALKNPSDDMDFHCTVLAIC